MTPNMQDVTLQSFRSEDSFHGLGDDGRKYLIVQVDVTGMSEDMVALLTNVLVHEVHNTTDNSAEVETTVQQDPVIT